MLVLNFLKFESYGFIEFVAISKALIYDRFSRSFWFIHLFGTYTYDNRLING